VLAPAFAAMAERLGDDRLAERSVAAASTGGGRDG
jgi:hypothetical protein